MRGVGSWALLRRTREKGRPSVRLKTDLDSGVGQHKKILTNSQRENLTLKGEKASPIRRSLEGGKVKRKRNIQKLKDHHSETLLTFNK